LLTLALFSPVLQQPQRDWPAQTTQTGFLFYDESESMSQLPVAVERFLDAGEPPLVFTLGSAAVSLAGDFFEQSALAAQRLGKRAVLLLGKNAPPRNLPSSIFPYTYLPYARMFPRAAAVVHQGGIGTTAQALRAGRPMLVMPFAHDQFDNASRVTRLGVARRIARGKYRAASAARELDRLLRTREATTAADDIGVQVRSERGLELTCDALERVLRS
jgi:UDP:flavonoid glycosyltransferase YjiC (YdhE family)